VSAPAHAYEIEPRVFVEVDDAACTVEDALAILGEALNRLVAEVNADPEAGFAILPRIRDREDEARRLIWQARARIVARCERHNEERQQRALTWARSL
jgi:hypothetical protein